RFCASLVKETQLPLSDQTAVDKRIAFHPEERQVRQAKEMEDYVQWLLRLSDQKRKDFFLNKTLPGMSTGWSTKSYHPYYSPEEFIEKGKEYRKYFHEEILGKFEKAYLPAN